VSLYVTLLALIEPKCLLYPVTFSGESDYRLSNACHFIYFIYIFILPKQRQQTHTDK